MKTEAQTAIGLGTISETSLAYISVLLLFISTLDNGIVGLLVRLIWIISFCVLCFINLGSALGTYIFSIVLYGTKYTLSPGPWWDRIDILTHMIILVACLILFVRKRRLLEYGKTIALIGVFCFSPLLYAAINGVLDFRAFTEFLRMFGLPFGIFILARSSDIARREVDSFFGVMMVVGIYMAAVAILEKLNLYAYILPGWINDPNINITIGSGRSGGPFMQSEFNGLALGLIVAIYWSSIFIMKAGLLLMKYMGMLVCFIGIYLSYTRAAWLSAAIATILLIFAKSDVKTGLFKKVAVLCVFLILVTGVILSPSKFAVERAGDIGTVNFRISLWGAALRMAMTKPLFGHGLRRFDQLAPDYIMRTRNVPDVVITKEVGVGTHNIIVNILSEQGLIGLVLFGAILLQFCSSAIKGSQMIWPKAGKLWLISFIWIYFFNAQFVNLHDLGTNLIFYATLGLLAGLKSEDVKPNVARGVGLESS
jgi:O-antigen ligase